MYINKVKRQLDRKVKIIRYNRGGEFYDKYDESTHNHNIFSKF